MRTSLRSCARGFGRLFAAAHATGRRRVYTLASLVACATGALLTFGLLPAAGSGADAPKGGPGPVSVVRELPELRTETSDTSERSDGTRVAKISRTPINYRDDSGAWQPISTTLQPGANGALQASSTPLPVSLPSSLSSPVTVGSAGATVSFSLQGAGGSASASGSSASYAEALPNVSATYQAQATRLKETLSLQSAAAPAVYHYHLSTTGGLTPKLVAGAIVFSDAHGRPRYVMPTPSVADAGQTGRPDTRDVHYALSDDGSQLDVVVNSAWLASPERVFPVTVDPTLEYWGDNVDCFIASAAYENESLCGVYLYLGYHTEGANHSIGRGLLRFELGSTIPQDSAILAARLRLTDSYTATSAQTIEVKALKKTPTNSATWNKYDGTNAWENKGGDFEASKPDIKKVIPPTEPGHQFSWGIAPLVEKWVRDPTSNHGLLLKAENEATVDSSWVSDSGEDHPYIEVLYSAKVGTPSDATLLSQQLGDRQGISVNVADGNLLLQNHILALPGVGFDLSINQFYNSRNNGYYRSLGSGASLSTAIDVRMEQDEADGSWSYRDPSGAWFRFDRNPGGDKEGKKAFEMPYALNAKLTEEASGTLVLEYLTARVKLYFDSNKFPSYLQKVEDANKNTETMHYASEGDASIEDTHGHSVTFKYNKTLETISSIKDALGRTWEFTDNSSHQLTNVKDPDLHQSKYSYTSGNLTQIEDPDKHLIELGYDASGKLTEIRHVVNGTASKAGTKDVITTFAYSRPATSSLECPTTPSPTIASTEVVSPNGSPEGKANSSATGHKTFYCFNAQGEVTKTINQRGGFSTANYDSSTGQLETYQNPGDTAGEGTVMNKIAYNPSGAATVISDGTGTSSSLDTTLTYGGGTGNGGQVEPSSVQAPFSALGQKGSSEKTHKTFYVYDEHGNLTSAAQDKETSPETAVKLTYNEQGQVASSTDPDGNVTKYKYNEEAGHKKGDLETIEPPSLLGATKLTYDSLDRVHSSEDGRKNTATYSYDGEDRIAKVEYSDGSTVSFKFDADGNTTERVDAKSFGEPYTGATFYEYDKLNRPILETTPTAKSTTYGYDYDGNLTSLKDAGGTVSYAYGSDDLLTILTEPENSAHPYKFGYETGVDNRESTTFPNGLLQCQKYDLVGRLKSFSVFKPTAEQSCASTITPSATLEDYATSYAFEEEVENEEGEKETVMFDTPELQTLSNVKASTATKYTYDTLDRLLKAVTKPGAEAATLTSEYEYDPASNMKLNHTYSPSTTYTNEHMKYNVANEICAIATTAPSECASGTEEGVAGHPTYDKDGEMTSDGLLSGANKFAYTIRDQLASITPHGESAKQVVSHGTGQADLAAIGSEEVVQNVLGVGVTGSGESAKYYTRDSGGTLLAKRTAKGKPSETEYFLPDPFGSVAILTNSIGSQTAPATGSYQYDPYGASIGAGSSPFGFESTQLLPGGVAHFGARYYDPMIGVWTQQDPISSVSDLVAANRYGYSGNDPVNEQDATGERPKGNGEEEGVPEPGVCYWVDTHHTRWWVFGRGKYIYGRNLLECETLETSREHWKTEGGPPDKGARPAGGA
jgi:RHS repeat-associated protein